MKINKKLILWILVIVLVFASFMFRVWPLKVAHWWDETVYLQHSEVIFSGRTNFDEFHLRPPILPIIIAFSYFFKHHVYSAGIVVSLLGALGVLFAYLLGRELYGDKIAVISALFIGLSPFIVKSSHWIMTSIPSLTFITISLYLMVLFNKKNSFWLLFFSGVFFSIAILTRFTSLVLLFLIPLYFFITKITFKKISYFVYGLILSITPYLVWAQIRYGFFLSPFIRANLAVSDKVGNSLFYLLNFSEVYPIVITIGLIIYLFFLPRIFNLKKLLNRKIDDAISIVRKQSVDTLMIFWIIIFLCYITWTPHKEVRYILPMSLPISFLSAKGYVILTQNKRQIIKYLSIVLLVILSFFSFAETFNRIDGPFINPYETTQMEISSYLKSFEDEGYVIYSNFDYPVYAYYSGMDVEVLMNQDQHFYAIFPDNMKEKGFFVYYKEVPKEPNQDWLDSNDKFKVLKKYDDIIVYEYNP